MISKIETKSSDKLSNELFDIFKNAIQEIEELAEKAPEQIVESVHLIRKRLKFLRAFVKLTQFCNREEDYKTVNYILRDSGRTISDCRDAHVRGMLLTEFSQNGLPKMLIDELILINNSVTEKIETDLYSGRSVFDEVISDISNEQIINFFESLEPDGGCLISGLTLGYKKSYHAFHSELKSHEADLLHEWRKRTKDLQYQLEALLNSIPSQFEPSYEEVVALCEILGRINDLFMFLEWLDSIEESVNAKDQIPRLKSELNSELKSLENQADKMGNLLFSLSPDEFSEKLKLEL